MLINFLLLITLAIVILFMLFFVVLAYNIFLTLKNKEKLHPVDKIFLILIFIHFIL